VVVLISLSVNCKEERCYWEREETMKVSVIGGGHIGSTVASLLVNNGHQVVIANSRGPDTLRGLVAELGPEAQAADVAEAAAAGDLALVAVPFHATSDLPAEPLAGKVVIDACNYYAGRDGHVPELDSDQTTSTEVVAGYLSGATLVKAFNTMNYMNLRSAGRPDLPEAQRPALFLAGDDDAAKQKVSDLIVQLGFAAVDTGSLAEGGRLQQPGGVVYNRMLTGSEGRSELGQST
jgi:8-hydroxy-5-deazaflavin:NADPH oxidoreductase